MSEETFGKADGVDLKELFNAQITNVKNLIEANDRNYNQRFENVIQATSAALAAADRAVNKAEGASEKRFDGVNEFRGTLQDQQRTLMPRNEVTILIENINSRLDLLTKTMNDKIDNLNLITISRQGQSLGQREGISYVIATAGVISIAITLLLKFLIK